MALVVGSSIPIQVVIVELRREGIQLANMLQSYPHT